MREQMPRETYRPGDRVVAYVLDVLRDRARSADHPRRARTANLVVKLFEPEVPEIDEGIVDDRGRRP